MTNEDESKRIQKLALRGLILCLLSAPVTLLGSAKSLVVNQVALLKVPAWHFFQDHAWAQRHWDWIPGFVPGDKVQFCLLMAAVFLTIFGVLDLRNAGQRLARYIRRNSGDNE